ncbi:CPBP family intramembrane glutamic endopeptidase [Clostridium sp. AL.422]|uniref:CPBP family intramembrane glutamic endopeptidase n=1 Tax=Clostridium TaxID=1485 RepID=UPI00293DADCF|nr:MULTISPECIES: CPBP family intramembrane glutamic endopeptidase [unclassified Clostridium]MDV4149908.1 CPBP family intramembrane glutamic endopeptidase [Clostridium sp. AL.422]
MLKKKNTIILIVLLGCLIMGFIDAVIRPQYLIKSFIKIILFSIMPLLYSRYNRELNLSSLFKIKSKKEIIIAVLSGIAIFIFILGAYFIIGSFFDFSNIVAALSENVGVNNNNFLLVAIYISFINSLLEEFFFRGFTFLKLKEVSTRKFAYIFSSLAFAFYHVAMMIGWFDISLFLLTIVGLFVGGLIFNYFNEKYKNIYVTWLIHMFANFAINYIGFTLFNHV